LERQSVLERMGWTFTRIRSSEFLRNPARAMKPVFEKLEKMEIPPTSDSAPEQYSELELIDRVLRRAEELRKAWSKPNAESPRSPGRSSVALSV
jgi:hypothetical protein